MPSAPVAPSPAPSPIELLPGTRLGAKYEIVRRLATGGMAEILLARVVGLLGIRRQVVIKRILPHLATQADFLEMFLNEARIATTLQHPNIVQMYEVGMCDQLYFIAMEHLEGEDLRAVMKALAWRRQRLPIEHAVYIASCVAAALHYAHDKLDLEGRPLEIVHRDTTPQNVFLTRDGGVKLLDFGVAKAAVSLNETRAGMLKGKVPYMSPEQCRSEKLDRRSDVFSLGIVLYELTLGRRPFRGRSDFEVLKAIVEQPARSPRAICPDFPIELELILQRALEKDREQRYASARELQADLESFARSERMITSAIALSAFMAELFTGPPEDDAELEVIRANEADPTALSPPSSSVGPGTASSGFTASSRSRSASLGSASASATQVDPMEPIPAPSAPGELEDLAATAEHLSPDPSSATRSTPPSGVLTRSERPLAPGRSPRQLLLVALGAAVLAATWGLPRLSSEVASTVASPSEGSPPPAPGRVAPRLSSLGRSDLPPFWLDEGAATAGSSATAPPLRSWVGDLPIRSDAASTAAPATWVRPLPGALEPGPPAPLPPRSTLAVADGAASASSLPAGTIKRSWRLRGPRRRKPRAAAAVRGQGTLVLASSPWCEVSVDQIPRGQTPLQLQLPSGKHVVLLSNPERGIRRSLVIAIPKGRTVRKALDFGR